MLRLTLLAGIIAFTAACAEDAPLGTGLPSARHAVTVLPGNSSAVDVLFVIDNSGSMAEEQEALISRAEDVFGTLVDEGGDALDLHVGVVTTDVGAGAYGISGCGAGGDQGRLVRRASQVAGPCNGPTDAFLIDGATRNFTGSRAEAFACMADVGTDGCGFEQPLEAMRLALDPDNAFNAGFLRDEALLLVVIVSDEDDCSATNAQLFNSDPSMDRIDSELGPLSSFRCFEFGVECDVDAPREPGARSSCRPRDASTHMTNIDEYRDVLRRAKVDPNRVSVAVVAGPVSPVNVTTDTASSGWPEPVLGPSCSSLFGDAVPAVRLAAFAGQMNGFTSGICSPQMDAALDAAAQTADRAQRTACMPLGIRDADSSVPGLQPLCVVRAERWEPGAMSFRDLAPCREDGGACFVYQENSRCESNLALSPRGIVDETVVASCVFD